MTVEAVVFDLDGVLIDSEPTWEEVRRRLVAERGGTWLPDSQLRLMGMSTAEWSRYLSEEVGLPMSPAEVGREVVERMAASFAAGLPLIPGASDAVRRLAGAWTLGLASSSPRSLIDAVLERAGLAALFRVTVSAEEVSSGKPSPDVYLEVARRLEIPAGRCVAVEDSSNGIRAAVAAGIPTVAISRPQYPVDGAVLASAAARLTDIGQLTVEVVREAAA